VYTFTVNNTILPKSKTGCPYLILAPMEGLGDRSFRKAMAAVGGFDEATTEFLRVPMNAHVQSLAARYQSEELSPSPIPLAAQLMGSEPELLAAMAREIEARGAPRIDLNCGCPSNTVTGRGAGSSLLKDPELLYANAKAMCDAVKVPVTVKMRSGFDNTSLFRENLLAAQESGARFITLHPRTKVEGYGPPARWDLIAEAKSILKVPLVGNGDILNVQDALNMLKQTNCDALMIGRGSVINPFIFHQIRAHFSGLGGLGGYEYKPCWGDFERYFSAFLAEVPVDSTKKGRINKLKQLMSMLFKGNEALMSRRMEMLTKSYGDEGELMEFTLPIIKGAYFG
jgi:tRNA-dihydrouridine synthase C